MTLAGKRITLVISGGIAAFKALDLIRRLRERGATVRCILTESAKRFVTPLSVAALSHEPVFEDLFSVTDDAGMAHILLSRESDLVLVAPATANLLAKMALGLADDLASATLLASDKPALVAPAMNLMMWRHPATQENLATLASRGVKMVGPASGLLADGEVGEGRLAEVMDIVAAVEAMFAPAGPLVGRHAIVTSGPTHEPIDTVRYIANRSSGKQGHAIAAALAGLGARVTLVSGPVSLPDPANVTLVRIETAQQMLDASLAALPADIAVCAAAVADWRVASAASGKLKKVKGQPPPALDLALNPDILATLSAAGNRRPRLVVGFAAETGDLIAAAQGKLVSKGCDLIVANDVSEGTGTFGGDANTVHLVSRSGVESWPPLPKTEVAARLAARIAELVAAP